VPLGTPLGIVKPRSGIAVDVEDTVGTALDTVKEGWRSAGPKALVDPAAGAAERDELEACESEFACATLRRVAAPFED
jgi:hypothetical protein